MGIFMLDHLKNNTMTQIEKEITDSGFWTHFNISFFQKVLSARNNRGLLATGKTAVSIARTVKPVMRFRKCKCSDPKPYHTCGFEVCAKCGRKMPVKKQAA